MGVVQVAVDEVVDVIAVRDGRMPASLAMGVIRIVAGAAVVGCAPLRVGLVDGEGVLVDVIAVGVVKVAVVQVVDVVAVGDGDMAAPRPVDVGVVGVDGVIGHRPILR
jgi:hypothetical protein